MAVRMATIGELLAVVPEMDACVAIYGEALVEVTGKVLDAPGEPGWARYLENSAGLRVLVRVLTADDPLSVDRVSCGELATVFGRAFRYPDGVVLLAEGMRNMEAAGRSCPHRAIDNY